MDSIVLHTSQYELIKGLSDEQLGKLLRALFLHNRGEEVSFGDDGLLDMAFGFIQDGIEREFAEKRRISELRSDAGKRGGAPKGVCNNPNGRRGNNKTKQNKTKQSKTKQNKTKQTNALIDAQNIDNQIVSSDNCAKNDDLLLKESKKESNKERSKENNKAFLKKEGTIVPKKETGEDSLVLLFNEPPREKTSYEKFQDFLKDECPYIYAHMTLPTEAQFDRLVNAFGSPMLAEVCRDLENNRELRKKYVNLNRTAINWCKMRVAKNEQRQAIVR